MLADLLWQDVAEEQAISKLRYQLRDLRKVVGDYVIASGDTIAFNQELPHWVDVATFTTYMSPIGLGSQGIEPAILQELLNLHRGEFLAGFQIEDAPVFEHWLLAQRRHLQDLTVLGLQLRTQQHLAANEYAAGLEINHYLLTLEPWREETHRQRMLLLAYSGQRSAALKQYAICCQALAEELDVLPMQQTTTLYEQIKSGQWFAAQEAALHHQRSSIAIAPFPQASLFGTSPESMQLTKHSTPVEVRPRYDLGSMPDAAYFYGREMELATLHSRIGQEQCRLAAIVGLSGQGKTALAAAFVQDVIEDEQTLAYGFTQIIWRSLADMPLCVETLQMWVQQLEGEEGERLPLNLDQLITRLFALLEERRCLLVLDGIDAIMTNPADGESWRTEEYRPGYEAYGQLFQLFFQRRHRSCLLLTGRRRPDALTRLDERNGAFSLLKLDGLKSVDSVALLAAHGIVGDLATRQQLHVGYDGNPLFLSSGSNLIQDLFDGEIAPFLQEGFFFLGDVGESLAQQLAQLPLLEMQILQQLAQAHQPLYRQELWESLTPIPSKTHFYHALQALQRILFIEQQEAQITIANLLATFLRESELSGRPAHGHRTFA